MIYSRSTSQVRSRRRSARAILAAVIAVATSTSVLAPSSASATVPSEPVPSQPVQPEPVQPEPVQPEQVQPEPVQPEPVQPEPVQPEQVPSDAIQPEAVPPVTNQRNYALGADATQSSTGFKAPANRATDGSTNGQFDIESVTSTAAQANPWWQVDLGSQRDVDLIRIWNREDCCRERLRDFWVFLSAKPFTSNDPNALAADKAVTAIRVTDIPNLSRDVQVTALARYVRIQIPRTEILSLAEVEVIGQPWRSNYAPDATVTQSSSRFDGDAFHANDANPDGNFSHHSVSHTQRQLNPWWQADLGFSRTISEVRVWNRTDCCAERLSNYWVQVSDYPFTSNDPAVVASSPNVRSFRLTSIPSPLTVVAINATGRYVRIQLQATEALSLAEVEILGPQLRDYVPGGVATQSSTGWGGIPEAAQDGNTNGDFYRSSLSHTAEQVNPWWQVKLASPQNITKVKVWNRTDCCVDRLRDFWVFLSPTPFTSNDPNVTAAQPGVTKIRVTTTPSPSVALNVPNVSTQYIRVQIPGKGLLGLAEVEAFGTETLAPINAAAWNAAHPRSMYVSYGMETLVGGNTEGPGAPARTFNPGANVNPSTWANAMTSAKMKLGVYTAKPGDGFAMWPSSYSNYSIAASPYQGGRGDLVRDFCNAMRAANLDVGLQFSIYDRTNNNTLPFIKNQLRELLTRYGTIQYLYLNDWRFVPDWTHKVPYNDLRDYIRNISPSTIVSSDDSTFSLISSDLVTQRFYDGFNRLPAATSDPKVTITSLDVSPSYFWTAGSKGPRTAQWVWSIQRSFASVNSTLLLGVGPRADGTLDPRYITVLQQVGQG